MLNNTFLSPKIKPTKLLFTFLSCLNKNNKFERKLPENVHINLIIHKNLNLDRSLQKTKFKKSF